MLRKGSRVPAHLLTTCKRCGSDAYWETSEKTGKNYLANVGSDEYGYTAQPDIPHTKTDCQAYVDGINHLVEGERSSRVGELTLSHPDYVAAMAAVSAIAKKSPGSPEVSAALEHAESVRDRVSAQAREQVLKEMPIRTVKSDEDLAEGPAPKPKGFTNKFPGKCVGCGTQVGTGEGITSKGVGGWEVRCVGCHHG